MDWVVPTVIVDRDGVAVTINEADFDAATMRLWGDEANGEAGETGELAKPRGRPRKVTGDDS